jgi:hypothetical protein
VAHTCDPSYLGDRDQEGHSLKPAWAHNLRDSISGKPITKKRAGGVVQVVECLPSKYEALSLNPNTTKK